MIKTPFSVGVEAEAKSFIKYLKVCPITGSPCNKSIIIDRNKVFLAEPYDDENREQRESIIKKVLSEFYLSPLIASEKIKSNVLFCKICEQIQSSYFCIIDLTKEKSNVFIELGMSYGFQKPTIIIFEKNEEDNLKIPTDLQGLEYIGYEDYTDLENKLKDSLEVISVEYNPINLQYNIKDVFKFLEIMVNIKNLRENPNIIAVEKVVRNSEKRIIIDKGSDFNIKKGMIFNIHKKYGHLEDEEPLGILEITYTSKKFSYGVVHTNDLKHIKEIEKQFADDLPKDDSYVLIKPIIDESILNNLKYIL